MEEKIHYIKDEDFRKLTKKQKLELPQEHYFEEIEISRLVLIPVREKNDGYSMSAFFAFTPEKGWWRAMTYDCWQIVTDIYDPIVPKYQILKGDFENGGVQIFGFADQYCQAFLSYGGQITIKKKV